MAILSKNVTTYLNNTKVKKYNGPKFNMSRLYRSVGKDGKYIYKTTDGTIVSDGSGKLSQNAWNYLASKYGKDYANRTSANMRAGNIWQNGRWRPNYANSGNKTVSWDTATKGKDMNTFNKAYQTFGRKGLAYNGVKGRVDEEAYNGKWDNNSGVAGNILKWGAGKLGYKLNDTAATVGELGAYFIPGVGTALAAGDAVDSLRKGEYGQAAINAMFAIPGLGAVGKLIKGGMKLSKVGRAATKLATKTALTALTNSRGYRIGETISNIPLNILVRVGSGLAGAGLLLSLAPTLCHAGKAWAKNKYYGDDYENYTFNLRKQDAMDVASNLLDKQDIENQFDDALTNALYSSNDYGYGYSETI